MKAGLLFLVFFVSVSILPLTAVGQCAMCKAVVESGAGSKLAEGVNDGILYMMGFPYLLFAVVGFLWYKKYMKKDKISDTFIK